VLEVLGGVSGAESNHQALSCTIPDGGDGFSGHGGGVKRRGGGRGYRERSTLTWRAKR